MLLLEEADLRVFWGLCEEVEALYGMRARERRLGEYWGCMEVLKMCIFVLPHAIHRLHLLAKAQKHAQIRLLQQLHRSTDFAPAAIRPYACTNNATS